MISHSPPAPQSSGLEGDMRLFITSQKGRLLLGARPFLIDGFNAPADLLAQAASISGRANVRARAL